MENAPVRGVVIHDQDGDLPTPRSHSGSWRCRTAARTEAQIRREMEGAPTPIRSPATAGRPSFPPIVLRWLDPSPVPPYLRVVELSACVNGSRISCCFSAGIPIPVSLTATCKVTVSVTGRIRRSTITSPCAVNLMALPTRLTRICRRRPGRRQGVRHCRAGRIGKLQALLIGPQGERLRPRPGCRAGKSDRVQRQLAGFDLGEIEDVVEKLSSASADALTVVNTPAARASARCPAPAPSCR